ncbi:MAG: hypothetical protein ACRD23_12855 [Terriglobales bacterium]
MLVLVAAVLSPGFTSCGGGTSSTTPPGSSVTVTLSPHYSAVTTSQAQTFTASSSGSTGTLSWFVDGVQGGTSASGTIASAGDTKATYMPTPSTTPGKHTVTARTSGGTMSSAASVAVTDLAGVFTSHNGNARTGQNLQEYALTASTVSAGTPLVPKIGRAKNQRLRPNVTTCHRQLQMLCPAGLSTADETRRHTR